MVVYIGSSIITFFFFLISKVKRSVSENLCYNDSIRNTSGNYNFESCDKLLENVNGLYMRLQESDDPDAFYSSFTSLISSNAETFLTTLDHFTATVMAINLARQIHQKFLKQKDQSTSHTQKTLPLTKNELDGFQYLCGYAIKNLIKNLKTTKITKLSNIKL